LSSMTGFARGHGLSGPYAWTWEIKSVNGKGLDVRLRTPAGWDAVELPVRARAAETLSRGSVQANLTIERSGAAPTVRVNAPVLETLLAGGRSFGDQKKGCAPPARGVVGQKGRQKKQGGGENGGRAAPRGGGGVCRFCRGAEIVWEKAPGGGRGVGGVFSGAA